MRYEIEPGIVVKTENAAKPESQGSTFLRSLLADLPHVYASVDFGCGKLRYCDAILEKTDILAIVDSETPTVPQANTEGCKIDHSRDCWPLEPHTDL